MQQASAVKVSCPKCGTQYALGAKRLNSGVTSLRCSQCGHVFPLRAAAKRMRKPSAQWRIRRAGEQEPVNLPSLDTLRRWIIEGRVGPEDEISRARGAWKRLGSISKFRAFFRVQRRSGSFPSVLEAAATDAQPDGQRPLAARSSASAVPEPRHDEPTPVHPEPVVPDEARLEAAESVAESAALEALGEEAARVAESGELRIADLLARPSDQEPEEAPEEESEEEAALEAADVAAEEPPAKAARAEAREVPKRARRRARPIDEVDDEEIVLATEVVPSEREAQEVATGGLGATVLNAFLIVIIVLSAALLVLYFVAPDTFWELIPAP